MRKILHIAMYLLAVAPLIAAQPYKDAKSLLTAVTKKTGWDKWQTLKSVQVNSRMDYLDKARIEVWQLPNQYYSKSTITTNGRSVVVTEAQTPQKSWRYEADTKRILTSAGIKSKVFPVHELTLLHDPTARLEKDETLKGKVYYVVSQPTRNKKFRHKFYFEKSSLLLVAVDWNYFDTSPDPQWYEDYRVVNGFWFPFKEVITTRMTKTVNEVLFNVNTTSLFIAPK
ncbi:MAG: hypothetical protein J0L94_06345 [Rhodothermia bacterium]|nr:hypothetical protein [Rhodothermia bacterium]